ncbi:hypothetical protein Tco_1301858 [Tanacetum coccineum]
MMHTYRGDGVVSIKRRCRDISSDGVENLTMASGCNRLKSDLEDSTWRRRHDHYLTPSQRSPTLVLPLRPVNGTCTSLSQTKFSLTIQLFIMENANPSSSTPNSEFLDPMKKLKIESWLEDSHFLKRQAYIDLESPINVMSKQHYKWIMSKGLESRQKPSNPRSFTYITDFVILEDIREFILSNMAEVVIFDKKKLGSFLEVSLDDS